MKRAQPESGPAEPVTAPVSRETARALAGMLDRFALPADSVGAYARLIEALAAEADPPTTVRDPLEVVDVHLADSLTALEFDLVRSATAIADVGAGAGFPGLALAIALPDTRVDLIESVARKAEVIDRLAAAAGIADRARAVPVRAEEWAAGGGGAAYDVVTARAVAALPVLVEYAAPLLRAGGALVAYKGAVESAEEAAGETAAAEVGLELAEKRSVTPYPGSERHQLYLYSKVRATPGRFPRRPGAAAKRPLGR